MQKSAEAAPLPAVEFVHTDNLPAFFREARLSLVASTYQAGRIMTFAAGAGKLNMTMRLFERPMGLAVSGGRMAVCCRNQIWLLKAQAELRDLSGNKVANDATFIPRQSFVTGDIHAHELAWFKDQLIIVNTSFSCLASISTRYSFEVLWKPPFITDIAPEDRCHLNGLALGPTGPKFVTALSVTNTKDGWREKKVSGGCIIDIASGEIICRGLSMPHSPRWYREKLWVLDSGTGSLQLIEPASGRRTTVIKLPGFLRGLSFYGDYAFVGLSKMRESNIFGGLPIGEQPEKLECAIYIVDLRTGQSAGSINFTKGIEELFSVEPLPGMISPEIIGFEEDTINGIYILNDQAAGSTHGDKQIR